MTNDLAEFERAVLAQAPPGAIIVGTSLSPDGRYAATLTALPSASEYLMDDVFERTGNGWRSYTGGRGGGISWSTLGETEGLGVLRYGGEAAAGATAAWVSYEGSEHRVPVRNGFFLFVAWNTDFHEDPQLLHFDRE